VAIDDTSIAQIGRWPWPRTKIATLIDRLSERRKATHRLDIVFLPAEGEQVAGNDRLLGNPPVGPETSFLLLFHLGKPKGKERNPEVPPQIKNAALLLFDDPKKFFDFSSASAKVLAPVPEITRGAKGSWPYQCISRS